MIKRINIIALVIFLYATIMLAGCGKDSLFDASEVSSLEQSIFIVPANYTGLPFIGRSPAKTVYLDTNETIKIWAVYSLDGQYLTQREASSYIQGNFWEVEGESINLTAFRASFDTPGHRQVLLRSIDFLNDTIVDTLEVYVNTPIAVELVSPENKYNQVDPLAEEGVFLSWKISGTDPWENATCSVYASNNKDSVWNTLVEQNDCSQKAQIEGSLVKNIEKDTSLTFYWAVKAANFVDNNFIEIANSPIYQFSTKFLYSDSAVVVIPILYSGLKEKDSVNTQIILTNSAGDTIKSIQQTKRDTTIRLKVKAQTGLQVLLKELNRTDYRQAKFKIDVPEASLFLADSVIFYDSIPPQVAPLKGEFPATEEIKFFALDNGSGIDANRVSYVIESDTLQAKYSNSIISFKNPCTSSCMIRVSVFDNAKNQSPEIYWKIDIDGETTYIHGPFARREERHE